MQVGRTNPYDKTMQTTTNYDNKKINENKDNKLDGTHKHEHHHKHTKPTDGIIKSNGVDTIQFSQKSLDALNKNNNDIPSNT